MIQSKIMEGTMWYAEVKYSRQPIPAEYEFDTEQQAIQFCELKEEHNPYVRWTKVHKKRRWLNQDLMDGPIAKEVRSAV